MAALSLLGGLSLQAAADLSPQKRPDAVSEAALRATAQKFEAAFLAPMVTEMLRTAGPASFGAGNAEEIWRSVQAGAIAEEIARGESTGIAQSLMGQLRAYGK